MNTNDFKPLEYNPDTCWDTIFKLQKKVFVEYMKQEKIDWPNYDFDINCYEDQQLLKDFLEIRFVEELTEATEDMEHEDHFLEEMIDALNFLVEAYIIYGWGPKDLKPGTAYLNKFDDDSKPHDLTGVDNILFACFYYLVESVGKTCNKLKNRPWKQCQYLVDLIVFEERFKEIFKWFMYVCNYCRITQETLFKVWSQKYQCNLYRISTRY